MITGQDVESVRSAQALALLLTSRLAPPLPHCAPLRVSRATSHPRLRIAPECEVAGRRTRPTHTLSACALTLVQDLHAPDQITAAGVQKRADPPPKPNTLAPHDRKVYVLDRALDHKVTDSGLIMGQGWGKARSYNQH